MYTLEHQGHLTFRVRLAMCSFPTDKIIKMKDQKQEWMTPTVSWIVCISQICDLCFILFFLSLSCLNYHALSCCLNSSIEIVWWLFYIHCAQAKWKKKTGLKIQKCKRSTEICFNSIFWQWEKYILIVTLIFYSFIIMFIWESGNEIILTL